jgi:hypothetical protein
MWPLRYRFRGRARGRRFRWLHTLSHRHRWYGRAWPTRRLGRRRPDALLITELLEHLIVYVGRKAPNGRVVNAPLAERTHEFVGRVYAKQHEYVCALEGPGGVSMKAMFLRQTQRNRIAFRTAQEILYRRRKLLHEELDLVTDTCR